MAYGMMHCALISQQLLTFQVEGLLCPIPPHLVDFQLSVCERFLNWCLLHRWDWLDCIFEAHASLHCFN